MEEKIFEEVKAIIAQQLQRHNVTSDDVTMSVTVEGLGATDVDKVQIITKLQVKYDVAVPMIDEPDCCKSIQEIVKYIVKRYHF